MIKHQYRLPSGFCFLECVSMLTDIPLLDLTACSNDAYPVGLIGIPPKMLIIRAAIEKHVPWVRSAFDAIMNGLQDPDKGVELSDRGAGIAMEWWPERGKYEGEPAVLKSIHSVAFEDETIYDPEVRVPYSKQFLHDCLARVGGKIVYVAMRPDDAAQG